MDKKISEENIRKILADVKHPAIDRTLLDMGIIKAITIENNDVTILFAFPFPHIPIKDQIIDSVREPLDKEGIKPKMETTVMDKEELNKFLVMEKEGWKGGI